MELAERTGQMGLSGQEKLDIPVKESWRPDKITRAPQMTLDTSIRANELSIC